MDLIKFICLFFLNLIRRNIIKIAIVFISIVSFFHIGTFEPVKNEIVILQDIKLDSISKEYLYLYSVLEENEVKYKVLNLNEPVKLSDGKYVYYSYNGMNVLMFILFVVSLALVVIGTSNDDTGWNIQKTYIYTISRFVICEVKNDKYYYILFGRLIFVSDELISEGYIGYSTSESIIMSLDIKSLSDLRIYPKFKTKVQKRD